jgi:hypothetical protein
VSFLKEAPHHPLPPLVLQEDTDAPAGHRSTEFIRERRCCPCFLPPPVPRLHGERPSGLTCPVSPLQHQDGYPTRARLALVRHATGKLIAAVSSTCPCIVSAACEGSRERCVLCPRAGQQCIVWSWARIGLEPLFRLVLTFGPGNGFSLQGWLTIFFYFELFE